MINQIKAAGAGSTASATDDLYRRRSFLTRLVWIAGSILVLPAYSRETVLKSRNEGGHAVFIEQARLMKSRAVEAGDQPYGAIVVRAGQIVGFGPSRVITGQDPTAHAEMEAIRDAARRLGTRELSECVLYSTSRPCRMCETASYWADISLMYFGVSPSHGEKPEYGC